MNATVGHCDKTLASWYSNWCIIRQIKMSLKINNTEFHSFKCPFNLNISCSSAKLVYIVLCNFILLPSSMNWWPNMSGLSETTVIIQAFYRFYRTCFGTMQLILKMSKFTKLHKSVPLETCDIEEIWWYGLSNYVSYPSILSIYLHANGL